MDIKHARICSDLHLEGFLGRDPATLLIDFIPEDLRDASSVLVLAGDISSVPDQLVGFLRVCRERFPRVIFIPGNHEHYRHNYDAYNMEMRARLDTHLPTVDVALADETRVFTVGTTRFVCTTMWGDGGPTEKDKATVGFYLNDFRLITRGTGTVRFTVEDMITEHRRAKISLHAHLKQPWDGKTVVVTHHLPSRRLVSERFLARDGSDGANGGFVGASEDILAYDHAPDVWIHGHTHDSIDTVLWKTRVVCNPAGYRGEWKTAHNNYWGETRALPKFIDL